jgi:hypothetical protein
MGVDFYRANGIQEDFVELHNGAIIGFVENNANRFAQALSANRIVGLAAPQGGGHHAPV